MPSVYITQINSGTPIPSFQKKGIANQMPGVVGEVPILVEARHTMYPTGFLAYLIHVILGQVSIIMNQIPKFFNAFKSITVPARLFEVPVSTFRFKNLSPAEVTELKAMGLQQDLTNKNLFVGTPSMHYLNRLNQLRPIDDRIRPGHINFDAYIAWVYLMKGVQIFTTAHNAKEGYTVLATKKSIKEVGKMVDITTQGAELMDVDDKESEMVEVEPQGFRIPQTKQALASFPGSYHDIGVSRSFGHGIFFPFFGGMNTADKSTSAEVFAFLFEGTVGNDGSSEAKVLNKIRSGARQLAFSRTGMVLAHIYKVFSIADRVPGSKVTIVTKGASYMGVAVEGEFNVTMYGTSTASGDMSEDLKGLNLLESQADEVCELLNAVEEDGKQVYFFTREDFMRSRSALRCFNSVRPDLFHSTESYEKVRGVLGSMDFSDVFPLPNHDLLLVCTRYMATGQAGLLDEYPAFLGSGVLHSRSRTFEALSMFGPRAPSFNTGDNKGTMITIPGPSKEDKNLVKVEGVRPLAYFPFWAVPINVAASQWDKAIMQGTFSIPKGRKGKKEFTDLHRVVFSVSNDPGFTELYGLLKGMVNDARAEGKAGGSKKRGRDDEDGDRKGKKARTDFDDLF